MSNFISMLAGIRRDKHRFYQPLKTILLIFFICFIASFAIYLVAVTFKENQDFYCLIAIFVCSFIIGIKGNENGSYAKTREKIIMYFAGLIYLFSWLFFGFSVLGLLCEIGLWDKTGHWITLTVYKIFANAWEPSVLFSMPYHLGTQNLLNGILFSSAPLSCFIAFGVLRITAFIIAAHTHDS